MLIHRRLASYHADMTEPISTIDAGPDHNETEQDPQPWLRLRELMESGDTGGLVEALDGLPTWEQARAFSRLEEDERTALWTLLPPERAAELVEVVTVPQAIDVVLDMEPAQAAAIVDQLPSDVQADVIAELDEGQADAILEHLPESAAEEVRELASYDPDTAGGLMIREYLAYYHSLEVADVIDDLRRHGATYADYDVQYGYVVDTQGRLAGVLRLRDLLFQEPDAPIESIMIRDPHAVAADATIDALKREFDERHYVGMPVVEPRTHRLLGVVRADAVSEAVNRQSASIFLKFSGIVGGEEFRSMRLYSRSGRRLAWLSINIVLNLVAASVIAFYTDTLEAAIALAVFLPMISDMSGCSGNQAVAISMRELTLGLVRPREVLRVVGKEASVGIINGLALGLLLGLIAFIWKGNPYIGLVVGSALAGNTLVAVCLGGSLPLLLRMARLDPAMVSGPILTTITDMCGFFFVLSLATVMLDKLT